MLSRSLLVVGLLFASLAQFTVGKEVAKKEAVKVEGSVLREIFNGKNLSGWDGDPRLWSVREGVIHGETTDELKANGNTFLIWKEGRTGDFELHITFRCGSVNNSGIQYRSGSYPKERRVGNKWAVRGYQHEIRNAEKFPDVSGFIYDEGGKRSRICLVGEQATWEEGGKESGKLVVENLLDEKEFQKIFKLDDWNKVVIIAKGNHIQHYMNGTLILDFTDNHPKLALTDGVLALQLHAGQPMWVDFKDIRIKDLNPTPEK